LRASREKKLKISLFGNFGTQNLGNESTLQAIIHNIPKFLPKSELNCICSNPEDVLAMHGIAAFPISHRANRSPNHKSSFGQNHLLVRLLRMILIRIPIELFEWVRAIKVLKGRDMLVMTGTGMLTDCEEGRMGLPYEIFKWAISARICRLKLLFVSVGVEQMRYRTTRFFIKSSLWLADYICYRDTHSNKYMISIGFNKNHAIYPDMAFSLPEAVLPSSRSGIRRKPVIGVGLFDYAGRGISGEEAQNAYRGYIDKLSTFVIWLLTHDYAVRVLIGDIVYDNPVREDLQKALAGMGIKYDECQIIDEPIASVKDLLEQIATTDMVVATRFHNVVFALMLNKPIISISHNDKNDSLMANVGLSDYCQRIDQFDLNTLIEQFMQLEKNMEILKLHLERKAEEYRRALDEQYFVIFNSEAINALR
jgi:polysaccharide pyruvyl transferase WcaK-like protein